MSDAETKVVGLMAALEASVAKAKEARDRKLHHDATSPLACRSESNGGLVCDLQPKNHGGYMHSGIDTDGDRVWWDKETGEREKFGAVDGG